MVQYLLYSTYFSLNVAIDHTVHNEKFTKSSQNLALHKVFNGIISHDIISDSVQYGMYSSAS